MKRLARERKIHRLQKEIQLNPTEKHNYFRLVELYRESHQYAEAKDVVFHLLRLELDSPMTTEAFLWLAELCLDQGDTQGALHYRNKAASVAEDPSNSPSLHELRGRILLNQYRTAPFDERDQAVLDEAIESFECAMVLDSDPRFLASAYLRLGLAYHDKNLPDVAADYLTRALAVQSIDPQRAAECHMELGLIELWDRDNPEKAIPLFQLALETSPLTSSNWLSHCYWSLSCAFLMTDNARDAIEAGKKALKAADSTHPDYPAAMFNAHYVLGAAYSDIPSKEDLAIRHYSQAVAFKKDPEAYQNLGELYHQKGEFNQALKMFKEILRIDPDYSRLGDVYNAIGICLARMERHEEALTSFERTREEQATISFKPFEIYNNMGVSYWRLGKYDEATDAFKTALSLMHPKDGEYRRIEWYLREVQSGTPSPEVR